jgi:hypothetical protein
VRFSALFPPCDLERIQTIRRKTTLSTHEASTAGYRAEEMKRGSVLRSLQSTPTDDSAYKQTFPTIGPGASNGLPDCPEQPVWEQQTSAWKGSLVSCFKGSLSIIPSMRLMEGLCRGLEALPSWSLSSGRSGEARSPTSVRAETQAKESLIAISAVDPIQHKSHSLRTDEERMKIFVQNSKSLSSKKTKSACVVSELADGAVSELTPNAR